MGGHWRIGPARPLQTGRPCPGSYWHFNTVQHFPGRKTPNPRVDQDSCNHVLDLWLRLPNSVTSLLFSNIYIGLRSMNALNTNFSVLPTKLLSGRQPTYLHSLITVEPPRGVLSSSVVNFSRSPTSSSLRITNRSFRYASPHL